VSTVIIPDSSGCPEEETVAACRFAVLSVAGNIFCAI